MRGILSELTLTEVVQTIGTGGVATSIFNQPRGGRMFFSSTDKSKVWSFNTSQGFASKFDKMLS